MHTHLKSPIETAKRALPTLIVVVAITFLWIHGPIAQLANYHDFADHRGSAWLPNALDVLSNLPFLLVGAWGLLGLSGKLADCDGMPRGVHTSPRLLSYYTFMFALVLTAIGSAFYHLAPDNARLVWDRLPIAVACAALLSAAYAETHREGSRWMLPSLLLFAVGSVAWWSFTEHGGAGDLGPYLALQAAPLLLIPIWQWIAKSPRRDRIAFGIAVVLYVLAKVAELNDLPVLTFLGVISGHTLKHLLASVAALLLTAEMCRKASQLRGDFPGAGSVA